MMERGHLVRLSAQREPLSKRNSFAESWSGPRSLADRMSALQTASYSNYLRPCAIFTASGSPRSLSIDTTPNKGPGARIMKA